MMLIGINMLIMYSSTKFFFFFGNRLSEIVDYIYIYYIACVFDHYPNQLDDTIEHTVH